MTYARPEALVETEWLAAHLDDPQIRIVDASFKLPGITPTAREDYDRGHIPGAVFFDIDDIAEPGTSLPHMIPPPELFARKMEGLGIGDNDRAVVYDSAGLSSAGRAWWMLRLFAHDNVTLLNGGLPKWQAEGRPLETVTPTPPQRRFTPQFNPGLVRDKRALLDNLATRREQVVDARALGKVIGGGLPAAAVGGRAELMSLLAPAGDVYQAGTLSGNPLAVAAGLATLTAGHDICPA